MLKYDQKGEIITLLTLGTLIVLTATSFFSSFFLYRQKETLQTKAASPECTVCKRNAADPNECKDLCQEITEIEPSPEPTKLSAQPTSPDTQPTTSLDRPAGQCGKEGEVPNDLYGCCNGLVDDPNRGCVKSEDVGKATPTPMPFDEMDNVTPYIYTGAEEFTPTPTIQIPRMSPTQYPVDQDPRCAFYDQSGCSRCWTEKKGCSTIRDGCFTCSNDSSSAEYIPPPPGGKCFDGVTWQSKDHAIIYTCEGGKVLSRNNPNAYEDNKNDPNGIFNYRFSSSSDCARTCFTYGKQCVDANGSLQCVEYDSTPYKEPKDLVCEPGALMSFDFGGRNLYRCSADGKSVVTYKCNDRLICPYDLPTPNGVQQNSVYGPSLPNQIILITPPIAQIPQGAKVDQNGTLYIDLKQYKLTPIMPGTKIPAPKGFQYMCYGDNSECWLIPTNQ